MKVLFFIFLSLVIIKPAFAQNLANPALANPAIGRFANLCSFANRQFVSGKSEESLALYQKAIAKAESDFGKSSRVAGDMYYQLGVRALWLSRFDLAEYAFKQAVQINPNSEAAQIMLINLLRFRNRDVEANAHIQQAIKKHPDSASLRKDLVISLQDRDPYRASEQAYLVSCVQNGLTDKIPAPVRDQPVPPSKPENKEAKIKSTTRKNKTKSDNIANKKANPSTNQTNKSQTSKPQTSKPQESQPTAVKAVYEPIKETASQPQPVKPKRRSLSHKKSNTSSSMPLGLVPPPPPMGDFPSSPHPGMKAKAGSIKSDKSQSDEPAEKPKKPASEKAQKPAAQQSSADADPDFLIEWASVKKKPGQSK